MATGEALMAVVGLQVDAEAVRQLVAADRLASSTERNVGAKCFNLFGWERRWNEWRPDWTRRDAIDANVFVGQRLRERTCERSYCAFS